MITRRTFLAAGLAGSAALGIAWWLRGTREPASFATTDAPLAALDPAAPAIVAAIVPVMLDGALPAAPDARDAAVGATVANVGRAVAGLAPAAQRELAQLFALLGFAPARFVLTGIGAPWATADAQSVAGFLERWRTSRWTLLRSAYDALHQLILAAWYGDPRAWPAIGYPGPPTIAR